MRPEWPSANECADSCAAGGCWVGLKRGATGFPLRRALHIALTERRLEMNTLSRREEETLLKETKARALKECDDIVREFAQCAEGRLISVAWACRSKWDDVKTCMKQYTGPEQMDALRARYIELRREHAARGKE